MLESFTPETTGPGGTPRPDTDPRTAAIDQVVEQLAGSGMRLDRFLALATEGLLPDDDLRELWRRHRDLLVPDWAA